MGKLIDITTDAATQIKTFIEGLKEIFTDLTFEIIRGDVSINTASEASDKMATQEKKKETG